MISQIKELVINGHGYESEGHVLFSVRTFPNYGILSGRDKDQQIAGSRVEIADYKDDPADFILWKPSKDDQPGWDSPWGFGRPGWHLECSAMSQKTLGVPFDIHSGGQDLIFPHHENELAQSCGANGKMKDATQYAKYWLHNGMIRFDGDKMSKSLGNILYINDLVKEFDGEVLRLLLLSTHYRQPINWTYKRLREAERILERWRSLKTLENRSNDIPQPVFKALLDDLNSPLAISEIHKMFNSGDLIDANESCTFFGFNLNETKKKNSVGPQIAEKITHLIEKRKEARIKKDFATADKIRESLLLAGVEINDNEDKTSWKIKDNFIKEKLENL